MISRPFWGWMLGSKLFNAFISSLNEGPLKQRKYRSAVEPTRLHMSQCYRINK